MKALDAVKNLRALADLLEKHGDAPLYMSAANVWFDDKAAFLQVAKDFPRPFAKVDDETTTGDLILRKGYLVTDGTINIRIRRSAVCTLIEPARPAKYECPSIFSPKEEAQLEQHRL